jgi:hypothetical protein
MTARAPVSEELRQAQVRSLFEAWIVRQPEKQAGMANTDVLKFYGWMVVHRPELLPSKAGDAYQHLKVDLDGLVTDGSV